MGKLRLLNLALAAALVAFVVLRSRPSELAGALTDTDWRLALAAAALNLPVLGLASLRSSLLFHRLGYSVPWRLLTPATVLGFVAGGLTPAASGELLRAAPLRDGAGVPFAASMAAVAYERVLSLYLLMLATLVVFALLTLPPAAGAAALLAGAALCLAPWPASILSTPLLARRTALGGTSALARALAFLLDTADRIRLLLRDAALLTRWSLVTLGMFGCIALQYWLLARGVASGVSFGDAWLALGVSTLAAVLTFIPLGLGVLDGSLATVLDSRGFSLEQGSVVALLVRAAVTLPLVLCAFASYLALQGRWRPRPTAGEESQA